MILVYSRRDHADVVVDRNTNTNQLLDTNVGVKAGGKWELAVPNGTYTVKIGIGDSAASRKKNVWVEGVQFFDYTALAANTFPSKTMTVKGSDGRPTVGVGSGVSGSMRLNFIKVSKSYSRWQRWSEMDGCLLPAESGSTLSLETAGGTTLLEGIEVVDQGGKKVSNGFIGRGRHADMIYHLPLTKPLDETMSVKSNRVIDQEEIEVPIELKDVKLPPPVEQKKPEAEFSRGAISPRAGAFPRILRTPAGRQRDTGVAGQFCFKP